MPFAILLCILVGLSVVIQSGISRELTRSSDLNSALLVNSIVALILCGVMYALALWRPQSFPSILRPHTKLLHSGPLMLWPGVCGFVIICGLPWALSRIGAFRAIAFVIGAQILGSLIWDLFVNDLRPSYVRVAGALLTMAGAVLSLMG